MAWVYLNQPQSDAFQQAIHEIETGSDRAAAVVAGSFVEEHLGAAIKSRLIVSNEDITHEMFRTSGPLGSFSSKIDLGFMMGLYNIAAYKELKTIKDIRNKFAHNLSTKSFDGSQQICSFASNLKLADQIPIYFRAKQAIFTGAIVMLTVGSEPDEPSTPLLPTIVNQTARQRYTRACQFFIAALSLVPEWEPPKSIAIF